MGSLFLVTLSVSLCMKKYTMRYLETLILKTEPYFEGLKRYINMIGDSFKLYDREPEEMVTEADIKNMYSVRRSFTDRLPWIEYLTQNDCFLLDDERSVAAVYDIFPTNAEGVLLSELARVRDNFKSFLNEVLPRK